MTKRCLQDGVFLRRRTSPTFLTPHSSVGIALSAVVITLILLVTERPVLVQRAAAAPDETFAFLQPSLVLTPEERRIVDSGQVLVRTLPGSDKEIVVAAIVAAKASGDSLVESVRRISEFKRGPMVLAIGRFSNPPNIHDLDKLTADDADLEAMLRCRPGDCGLKLGRIEMDRLRQAAQSNRDQSVPALQTAFRRLVLERVQTYIARGHAGISNYEDQKQPVNLHATFSGILRRSSNLLKHLPEFADYLEQYPKVQLPEVESFFYWAKELYGQRAVVTATHVSIIRNQPLRGVPVALVAGKQMFSTHYMNGSLNLTMILQGRSGSHNYLTYINRSEVDVLGGLLGPVKRALLERRLKNETRKILPVLRTRLQQLEALRGR